MHSSHARPSGSEDFLSAFLERVDQVASLQRPAWQMFTPSSTDPSLVCEDETEYTATRTLAELELMLPARRDKVYSRASRHTVNN
ncbi:hypothetical protein Pmani_028228 [Petrolisthes manimaculis]|uniref:Uncharacterized protein n=1 Tax=Petrolisthes manimaculis TaxID=1843537 RepID=A0AAE1P159_9EUCA|nr:hypothetical protein Pmani_028228 [Petrolisthes manimaculis]